MAVLIGICWLTLLLLGFSPGSSVASSIGNCPGYAATNVKQSGPQLTADLTLAGTACNTYGTDVQSLKLEVTYETDTRLRVKISDKAGSVYQIPSSVIPLPTPDPSTNLANAAITFSYVAKPFSFAVSRTSTQETLFNTSGFPIVFESQYLLLRTSLPKNPNLYGLGEHSDSFRLPTTNYQRTLWSRDAGGLPPGSNLYGSHPVYYDHRTGGTHGVFLRNSNGMDIKITTNSKEGQTLSYNTIGGIIDLYFMAGPSPIEAVQQYSDVVGKAAMLPYWGLGFHQCRYNYRDIYMIAEVVSNYSVANIPLETMWTDINYMDGGKDWTAEPTDYPLHKMQELVTYLHSHNQHYILIHNPGIGVDTSYGPYNRGLADGVFLKRSSGIFKGVCWPGVITYPDWFHPKTQGWWSDEFSRFFNPTNGVDIDGLWIDMNEPSNFCNYPCSDPAGSARSQSLPNSPWATRPNPRPLPGFPSDFQPMTKRQTAGQALGLTGRNLISPAYQINNTEGSLSNKGVDTDLIHANGMAMYDTHNMFGAMIGVTSYNAMLSRRPKSRPFIIQRSTFAGSGAHVGHWLGDNNAAWEDYRKGIAGVLNFAALFQLPNVGTDICGYGGNTTESLCARWAMLGAFSPFFRNHNSGWRDQEFYVWPQTVAVAARKTIGARYQLLDYLYTAFYEQSTVGTPVLNPLWFLYPQDSQTFSNQLQYFFGNAILVSPVTEEGATSVEVYLPNDIFYDFWTYKTVKGSGANVLFSNLGLTDIPVHIRGGTVIPMRVAGAMTTTALRTNQFNIVIAPGTDGTATGQLYLDDGDSLVQAAVSNIDLLYVNTTLTISGAFGYQAVPNISQITLLGLTQQPHSVLVNNAAVDQKNWQFNSTSGYVKVQVALPLTQGATVSFQ